MVPLQSFQTIEDEKGKYCTTALEEGVVQNIACANLDGLYTLKYKLYDLLGYVKEVVAFVVVQVVLELSSTAHVVLRFLSLMTQPLYVTSNLINFCYYIRAKTV